MRGRLDTRVLRGIPDPPSSRPDPSYPWSGAGPVESIGVAVRRRSLEDLLDRIEQGESDPSPLIQPALVDPDWVVASSAALGFVSLSLPPDNDVTAAPRKLLLLAEDCGAANPGALFGGLVATGDRRILAHLFLRRDFLTTMDQIHQLVRCQTGFPMAPVIEFYLDWLGTLPGDWEDEAFGSIAAAISRERIEAKVPWVTEAQRIYPAWIDSENPARILEQWTLDEFAQRIEPRLRALQAREEEPRAMDDVLRVWGLDP